jgi:hypothetical protein
LRAEAKTVILGHTPREWSLFSVAIRYSYSALTG